MRLEAGANVSNSSGVTSSNQRKSLGQCYGGVAAIINSQCARSTMRLVCPEMSAPGELNQSLQHIDVCLAHVSLIDYYGNGDSILRHGREDRKADC